MEEIMPIHAEENYKPSSIRSSPVHDSSFWDRRASSFSEYATGTGYAERFLKLMNVDPDWTVLDMACGGGTLAVPLAGKVKEITAVDFSENMLRILEKRCGEKGITNVRTIHGRWEDDWDELGIGRHDVAIASRSLLADDVYASLAKLNALAGRQVYISTSVGDGPFDRRLFEAVGRVFTMSPDYIYYYNLLHRMGIHANVAFVREDHESSWETFNDALDAQRWMFSNLTESEEDRIKDYLLENLLYTGGLWRLPYERPCRWAVMWWDKEVRD
jgi:SAM-dependent methyltransferase